MRMIGRCFGAAIGRWFTGLGLASGMMFIAIFIRLGILTVSDLFGNPNRHFYEVAIMWPLGTIVLACVVLFDIGFCVIPTLPIGASVLILVERKPFIRQCPLMIGLLFGAGWSTSLLYDYGIPQFRWYTDDSPDWIHGTTPARLGIGLAVQLAVIGASQLPAAWEALKKPRRDRS